MLVVAQGRILFNELCRFVPHTAIWYTSAYMQLKDKRRWKVIKWVLFLHDIAPAHQALATQKKLAYLGFQYLDYPPYSLYLVPSEYHLFPELKKKLKVRRFSSEAVIIAAAENCLEGQHSEFFLSRLQKLEPRAKKCTELRGDYVE